VASKKLDRPATDYCTPASAGDVQVGLCLGVAIAPGGFVARLGVAAGLVATLAAAFACSSPSSPDGGPATASAPSAEASALISLTNTERVRAGLGGLSADARLSEAAQIHAQQMADAGRVDHVLPAARYPTLADRLAATGYGWQAVGENLAAGQRSPAQALESWMESNAHRANILNATFTEIGAGFVVDRNGRRYFAQVLGRPGS
jgi:uncharacterized protein YkwD